MKKNLLFIIAAATVFAGCSNSEIVDKKDGGVNAPVESSEVPVTFGKIANVTVDQVSSRAAIETWNNTKIAVWGLERNGAWNTLAGQLFPQVVPVAAVVASGGNVDFENGSKYYYPMSSAVNFSFYACYPFPSSSIANAYLISNKYTVDGKTDIMWAKKEAVDLEVNGATYTGYNARYFRNGGAAPELKFGHCLTRLDFKASEEFVNNDGSVTPVAVKSVTVNGVPVEATLVVAGANEGKVTPGMTNGDLKIYNGDTALGSQNGIQYLILPGQGTSKNLGTVLLHPSLTGTYSIAITLVGVEVSGMGSDRVVTKEVTAPVTSTVEISNEKGFVSGSRYNVGLKVFGLQEVRFGKATIEDWTPGDDIDVDVN